MIVVLMMFSGINGQSATPDPIDATSTAFIVEATQNAQLQGFTAQSAPEVGGTATPLAGVCNTLTFRALGDVSNMIEISFQRANIIIRSVDVSAIEETANCIDFGVRETVVDVMMDVEDLQTLHDQSALGQVLDDVLAVIGQTIVPNLSEVRLKIGLAYGNQTRLFDLALDDTFWTDVQTIPAGELVVWLTERD